MPVAIAWNVVIRKKKSKKKKKYRVRAEWDLSLSSSSESAGSQTLEHTHTLTHFAHTHFSKLMSPRYPVCKSLLLFLFLHHNTRSKTPPPSNPNSILLKSDSEPTGAAPPHVDPSDEVKSSITFSALTSWKTKLHCRRIEWIQVRWIFIQKESFRKFYMMQPKNASWNVMNECRLRDNIFIKCFLTATPRMISYNTERRFLNLFLA